MKNVLTSLFLAVCVAQATLASLGTRRGEVVVLAHGPAGLRIEGRSAEVSVDDQASALVFRVPLAPLDTGIELRNRHLREALEADRYPTASLQVLRPDLGPAPTKGTVQGELTLHGQTHPVTVSYRVDPDGEVHGSFRLDLRDFGIRVPSYLGVSVAPEVEVEAHFQVQP